MVIVGILFLDVLLLLLLSSLVVFSQIGGLLPIWLSGLSLIVAGGIPGLLNLFVVPLFGLLLGYLLLIRLEVLSLRRFRGFGREVYDERLQFMSRRDALLLDESLDLNDVSMAWAVWSRAAEAALADAYQF